MTLLSVVGHRGLPIQNPFTSGQIDAIVETCQLREDDSILDLGCGRGELLIRLVERWQCAGMGLDRSPEWLAVAREEASRRTPAGSVEFVHEDIHDAMKEGQFYRMGLIACVGATHALGGPLRIIERLARRIRAGGRLVLGDGVWLRTPSEPVLAALGSTQGDYPTLDAWIAEAARHDLRVECVVDASGPGMDTYEAAYVANLRTAVADGEVVPGAAERIAWSEAHWDAITAELGFALLVLQSPEGGGDAG